jgi:hypothetical protein
MVTAGWTERAVSERMADRRREAEQRIRLPHRASGPGPPVLARQGDRS